jgi:hypothetical protein
MHPLGLFPAEKKDDPMWCNRVSHVKDVWAMYPDLVGRVTVQCMSALYCLQCILTRPLLPIPVGLLVHVAPWCRWCRFRSSDEVLGPLVSGDVEVCLSKQLFRGGQRFLQYGLDKGESLDPR